MCRIMIIEINLLKFPNVYNSRTSNESVRPLNININSNWVNFFRFMEIILQRKDGYL